MILEKVFDNKNVFEVNAFLTEFGPISLIKVIRQFISGISQCRCVACCAFAFQTDYSTGNRHLQVPNLITPLLVVCLCRLGKAC